MTGPLGRLQVSDDKTLDIASADDLRAAVLDADRRARASKHPQFVELTIANGDSLSMGVGLDVTVLSYVGADNQPPYYVSKASETAGTADPESGVDAEGEVVEFDYGGEWSEFSIAAAVPLAVGLDAFIEFLGGGGRSPLIEWEEA